MSERDTDCDELKVPPARENVGVAAGDRTLYTKESMSNGPGVDTPVEAVRPTNAVVPFAIAGTLTLFQVKVKQDEPGQDPPEVISKSLSMIVVPVNIMVSE